MLVIKRSKKKDTKILILISNTNKISWYAHVPCTREI